MRKKISTLIQEGYKLFGVSATCIKEGEHQGQYIVYMGKGKEDFNNCEQLFLNKDAVEILKAIFWNSSIILRV